MKSNQNQFAAAALAGLFALGTASAGVAVPGDKDKCSGKDGCKGKDKKEASSIFGEKEKCSGKDGCKGKDKGKDKDKDKDKCSGKDGCKGKDKKASAIL